MARVVGVPAVATSRAGRCDRMRGHASSRRRSSTYCRQAASSSSLGGSCDEESLHEVHHPEVQAGDGQDLQAIGDQHLRAAAPDVQETGQPLLVAQAPRRAEERQPRLLVAAQDPGTDSGLGGEAGDEVVAVARLPDGGGRGQQDLGGAQEPGAIPVAADRRQRSLDRGGSERTPDGHALAQSHHRLVDPARHEPRRRVGVGDEEADRVRAEVDRRERAPHSGSVDTRSTSVATDARSASRPTGFSITVSTP